MPYISYKITKGYVTQTDCVGALWKKKHTHTQGSGFSTLIATYRFIATLSVPCGKIPGSLPLLIAQYFPIRHGLILNFFSGGLQSIVCQYLISGINWCYMYVIVTRYQLASIFPCVCNATLSLLITSAHALFRKIETSFWYTINYVFTY